MIEMRVMGIALDTRTGSPIVVLHDKDNRKALPIWIGSAEASAIIRKIENLVVARPILTKSLFNKILKIRYNYNDKSYVYSGTTKINSNIKDTLFLTIDNKVASSTEKELLINTRQGKYFINLS